jgi:hypothetical protein
MISLMVLRSMKHARYLPQTLYTLVLASNITVILPALSGVTRI